MKLPVKPMLAEKSPAPKDDVYPFPFDHDKWTFEPKLDGNRVIAHVDGLRVTLYSRPGNDVTREYPDLTRQLSVIEDGVYDGEICWFTEGLKTNRQRLANLMSASAQKRADHLRLVLFDVLELNDLPLVNDPLFERRQTLFDLTARQELEGGQIEVVPGSTDGIAMWQVVEKEMWEGLVAKPVMSRYVQGNRGIWKKIKRLVREKFVVVGFTEGKNHPVQPFGALVLAEREEDGSYRYAGKVGTGWTEASAKATFDQLSGFVTDAPPFEKLQLLRAKQHIGPKRVTWLKPAAIAEVEYSDRSDDMTPIFPAFKGLVW